LGLRVRFRAKRRIHGVTREIFVIIAPPCVLCAGWLTRIGLDHRDVEPGGAAPGAPQVPAALGDRKFGEAAASHTRSQPCSAAARAGLDLADLLDDLRCARPRRTDGPGFFAGNSSCCRPSGSGTRAMRLT